MRNLQRFWKLILQNKWLLALLILSFIGFLDASLLTVEHYRGAFLKCHILEGCSRVLNSEYSNIYGVPVSLFGMLYYLSVFVGGLFYLDSKNEKFLRFLCAYTVCGFLASGFLVYLMVFVIEALCEYCLLSATTSTLLFILGLVRLRKLQI